MTRRVRTAVLISGNGSNLQAILDAAQAPDYPAEIVLVLSNNDDAFGLKRADNAGVPTVTIDHRNFPDRESFDRMMDAALKNHEIELVVMAGFMRILSPWFVAEWAGKLINIHPSLLPKFKGMHTHKRALEAGETQHGCSVHWVTPELDSGEIIAQAALEISPDDTPETLQQRVHMLEHQLYPEAVKKVARNLIEHHHFRVVGFPYAAINQLLQLKMEHDFVHIHPPLWRKLRHKHPESLEAVQKHLVQTITQPDYVGQGPHHFANIEMILRVPGVPLLVAVKIRSDRGVYREPLVVSAYLIKPATVQHRLRQGTLQNFKKKKAP